MICRVILLHIILFSALSGADAQMKTRLSFDRDSIPIAEEVDLILSIETTKDITILAVPRIFLDTIYSAYQTFKTNTDTSAGLKPAVADFEVVSIGDWDDSNKDGIFEGNELKWTVSELGDKRLFEHRFSLRFYDPGENIVLVPPILFANGTESDQYYEGGRAIVFVTAPEGINAATLDSTDIAPIKPIIEEAKNISDYYIYLLIGGLLILIFIGFFIWKRIMKNAQSFQQKPIREEYIPPDVIAIRKLTTLKSKELWQHGMIKEYQSELTYVIREYLESRYQFTALESTTDEIVKSLKKIGLKQSLQEKLNRILRIADLVKFAKAHPETNIHDEFLTDAFEFVDQTREIVLENIEKTERI